MTEPFGDPRSLRAGWANYEAAVKERASSERPRLFEKRSPSSLLTDQTIG